MIRKTYVQVHDKTVARVMFKVPNGTKTRRIYLVGDFNDWNLLSHPMQYEPNQGWVLTLNLQLGRAYQFRYLRDGKDWMCDSQADGFVYNPTGAHNFIVVTDPEYRRYSGDDTQQAERARHTDVSK
jgi:1,4-alpha-glucan branching enzyme